MPNLVGPTLVVVYPSCFLCLGLGWGPVFLNLFGTFIIEAKFLQFWSARQKLSEAEAAAPQGIREKLPYTAGEIVMGTGQQFRNVGLGLSRPGKNKEYLIFLFWNLNWNWNWSWD